MAVTLLATLYSCCYEGTEENNSKKLQLPALQPAAFQAQCKCTYQTTATLRRLVTQRRMEENAFAEFLRKPPKTGKENAVNVFKTSRERLKFTLRSEDIEGGI